MTLLSSIAVLYLQEQDTEGASLTFSQLIEDDEDTSSIRLLALSKDAWEDMGKPNELTVTIVPGDLLNEA